jgi:hypothetical protein
VVAGRFSPVRAAATLVTHSGFPHISTGVPHFGNHSEWRLGIAPATSPFDGTAFAITADMAICKRPPPTAIEIETPPHGGNRSRFHVTD